jgi:hypothetical protein
MTTDRDTAIRTLLVETVSRPARRKRGTVAVAAIAFLLGGGIAAGAISATASTREQAFPSDSIAGMFAMFLHGGHTVGPLVTQSELGSSQLDLGPRPADATGIATFIECGGPGKFTQTSGGEVGLEQKCGQGTGMGFSSEQDPTDSIVSLKADGGLVYTISAQWIHVPVPAGPSAAQQAALADGLITEGEYRAAVDRFAACMTGAGYPLTDIQYSPELSFGYGSSLEANTSGTVDRCQDSELSQVLKLWQAQK